MPSTAAWPTVASAINDAATELGLIANDIVDPFATVDPNILQLLRMLRSGGRDLVKYRAWTHLDKQYLFNLAPATQAYPLPADFRSMIDDSGWDRTTRYPMEGPISSEDWQFLAAIPVASNIVYRFRLWLSQLQLTPAPGAGVTDQMAYEYNSSSWVAVTGAPTLPVNDAPTDKADVLAFDSRLIVSRLKRDFRRNKKQDSQSEEEDYQSALFDAENEDSAARTIYIGGVRGRTPRKIDRWNIPDVIR